MKYINGMTILDGSDFKSDRELEKERVRNERESVRLIAEAEKYGSNNTLATRTDEKVR